MANWQESAAALSETQKAWARVRANLRESAGARVYEQWLKPIELIDGGDADTIRLALPSAFVTNWVRNHYADRLMLEFKAILPQVRSVSIETRLAGPRCKCCGLAAGKASPYRILIKPQDGCTATSFCG